jgi:uncharacterized membrane protein
LSGGIVAVATLGLIYATDYYGGQLAYEHGVGVRAQQHAGQR